MLDSNDPDIPVFTTARLVRAHDAARARLTPLTGIVAPLAKSRHDAPVPGDLLVLARQALRAIAPIAMSLGAPAPVPLHAPLTYAGLAAKLALATAQADTFRQRYFGYNHRLAAAVWHVLGWLEEEEKRRAVLADLERAGLLHAAGGRPDSGAVHGPEFVPGEAGESW